MYVCTIFLFVIFTSAKDNISNSIKKIQVFSIKFELLSIAEVIISNRIISLNKF